MEPAAIEDTKKGTTAVSQGPQTGSQAVGRGRAVSHGAHTGSHAVGRGSNFCMQLCHQMLNNKSIIAERMLYVHPDHFNLSIGAIAECVGLSLIGGANVYPSPLLHLVLNEGRRDQQCICALHLNVGV